MFENVARRFAIRKLLFAKHIKVPVNIVLSQAPAVPIYLVLKILSPSKTATSRLSLRFTPNSSCNLARWINRFALTTAMKRRIKGVCGSPASILCFQRDLQCRSLYGGCAFLFLAAAERSGQNRLLRRLKITGTCGSDTGTGHWHLRFVRRLQICRWRFGLPMHRSHRTILRYLRPEFYRRRLPRLCQYRQ